MVLNAEGDQRLPEFPNGAVHGAQHRVLEQDRVAVVVPAAELDEEGLPHCPQLVAAHDGLRHLAELAAQ